MGRNTPISPHFHSSDRQFQESYTATVGLLATNCRTMDDSLWDCFNATVGQLRCKSPTVAETVRHFLQENVVNFSYSIETQEYRQSLRRIASTERKTDLFQNIAFYKRFFALSFLKLSMKNSRYSVTLQAQCNK